MRDPPKRKQESPSLRIYTTMRFHNLSAMWEYKKIIYPC